MGYMRDFYRGLSVVSLQFGCITTSRKPINIRLNAIRNGVYESPVAEFNRILLPSGFVSRMNAQMKTQSERNAIFYRSLFPPPLGTKGVPGNDQTNQ